MPATKSTRFEFAISTAPVSAEVARKRNRIAAELVGPRAGFKVEDGQSFGFVPDLGKGFTSRWSLKIAQAWSDGGV